MQALVELIGAPQNGRPLEQFITSRRQEKQIHEQITSLLCSTLITPLEREDIEALSNALSRITKVTQEVRPAVPALAPAHPPELFRQQLGCSSRRPKRSARWSGELRHGRTSTASRKQNSQLHRYEGEADKLMIDLLGTSTAANTNPRR